MTNSDESISACSLASKLRTGGSEQKSTNCQCLVLDCRSTDLYNLSRISGALQIVLPSMVARRLRHNFNVNLESLLPTYDANFSLMCRSCPLVLYDNDCSDNTDSIDNNDNSVSCTTDGTTVIVRLLVRKLRSNGYDAKLLTGGFSKFQLSFPHLCMAGKDAPSSEPPSFTDADDTKFETTIGLSNLRIKCDERDEVTASVSSAGGRLEGKPRPTPTYFNDIFPLEVMSHLYLGNANTSADLSCLRRNGITCIVNVTTDVTNSFEDDPAFSYLRVPIDDHWSQDLSTFFEQAIAFIDNARTSNRSVLVHCLAGVSRSVTVTVAYLMNELSLSMNDAFELVRSRNPSISPNFQFMQQLVDFEKKIENRRTHDRLPNQTIHNSSSCPRMSFDLISTADDLSEVKNNNNCVTTNDSRLSNDSAQT